ncbi:MAG: hypothetical protein COA42_07715 [Alteromonadaceae bacterium]|nr:MAG: hypothetical protein COA42_07715 [Alteromonadaceae bacterium]
MNLLEMQLRQTSPNLALLDGVRQLSYAELNQESLALAEQMVLQCEGDRPLAILASRGVNTAMAMIAAFRAGIPFVPIDPNQPRQRLEVIVADCRPCMVFGSDEDIKQFSWLDLPRLLPTEDSFGACSVDSENIDKKGLAYIMYTSGTTGVPKAVMMPRDCVEAYVKGIGERVQYQADDKCLHTASFGFSASIRQLFAPLVVGAQVHIASQSQLQEPRGLLNLIAEQGITVWDSVAPIVGRILADLHTLDIAERERFLAKVPRTLLFSGAPLPWHLVAEIRKLFKPAPRLVNVYGQTESIGVCAMEVPETPLDTEGFVPVGYVYEHWQARIVDTRTFSEVAQGSVGELLIAGEHLSPGYLNQPELSQTSFPSDVIKSNVRNTSPIRYYRTGDLARKLLDKSLQIVGRVDRQIKIRGVRIELGDIEAALRSHIHVRDAVVVLDSSEPSADGEALIACVVLHAAQTSDFSANLRRFLGARLPQVMLPRQFVVVDEIPLNANGKFNYQALMAKAKSATKPKRELEAKNTARERLLTDFWVQALGLKSVDSATDFFDAGGDSISAMQLLKLIEAEFSYTFEFPTLLRHPTPIEFSVVVENAAKGIVYKASDEPQLITLKRGSEKRPPVFCLHGIQLYQDFAHGLPEDVRVYAIYAPIELDLEGLLEKDREQALQKLTDVHVDFIRKHQSSGPYQLVGISFGGGLAYAIAQSLIAMGEEVSLVGMFDTYLPDAIEHNLVGAARAKVKTGARKLLAHGQRMLGSGKSRTAVGTGLSQGDAETRHAKQLDVAQTRARRMLAGAIAMQPVPPSLLYVRAKIPMYGDGCVVKPLRGWECIGDALTDVHEIDSDHLGILRKPAVVELSKIVSDRLVK